MRITKIQSTVVKPQNQLNFRNVSKISNQPETTDTVVPSISFKGKGDGILFGLGGGVIAGLLAVGGAAIAGVVALPAVVGGAVIAGVGVAGAYVGDKIEEAISKNKKDNNDKN